MITGLMDIWEITCSVYSLTSQAGVVVINYPSAFNDPCICLSFSRSQYVSGVSSGQSGLLPHQNQIMPECGMTL